MIKNYLKILFLLSSAQIFAQQPLEGEFEGQAIGGKEYVDQILQTQLTLPKTLLTSNFDVYTTAYFDLDSVGSATNIFFKTNINNALRLEAIRLLRFFRFRKTQGESPYPYYFSFHMSTTKYNKLLKQQSRLAFKKPLPADSSYVIYSKADKAPEYYKNGEEGLAEYVLTEIEYPKLAVEKSVEGTVIVEFVVETNGYITSVSLKKGLGAGCAEEAIRLIKGTKWSPAVLNGKWVRYKMTYPITFSLRNITRDASSTIGQ